MLGKFSVCWLVHLQIFLILATSCRGSESQVTLSVMGHGSLVGTFFPGTAKLICEGEALTILRWRFNEDNDLMVFDAEGMVGPAIPITNQPGFVSVQLTSILRDPGNLNSANYTSVLIVDLAGLHDRDVYQISCGDPSYISALNVSIEINRFSTPTPMTIAGQNIDLRSYNLEGSFCPGFTILNCTLTDALAAQWIFDPGSDILVTYLTDNDIGDTSNTNPAQVRALLTGLTINPTDPDFGNFTTTLFISLEYLEARGIEEISCRAGPVVQTQPVDVTVLRDPIPNTPVIESIEAAYEFGDLASVSVSWVKENLQCGETYQVTFNGTVTPETVMIPYNDCGERLCVHTFTGFTVAVETYQLSIIASNNFGSSNAVDPVPINGQRPLSFSPGLFIGSCPPTGYCADSPDSVCTVRITDSSSTLVTSLTVRGGSNFTIPGLEANTTYYATFSVMEGIVLLTEELTSTTGAGPVSIDICQVGVAVGILVVLLLLVVAVTVIFVGLGYRYYRDQTNNNPLRKYWLTHVLLILLTLSFAVVCIILLAILGSVNQQVIESCDGSLEGRCTGLTIGAIITAVLSLVAAFVPLIPLLYAHQTGFMKINSPEEDHRSKPQTKIKKGLFRSQDKDIELTPQTKMDYPLIVERTDDYYDQSHRQSPQTFDGNEQVEAVNNQGGNTPVDLVLTATAISQDKVDENSSTKDKKSQFKSIGTPVDQNDEGTLNKESKVPPDNTGPPQQIEARDSEGPDGSAKPERQNSTGQPQSLSQMDPTITQGEGTNPAGSDVDPPQPASQTESEEKIDEVQNRSNTEKTGFQSLKDKNDAESFNDQNVSGTLSAVVEFEVNEQQEESENKDILLMLGVEGQRFQSYSQPQRHPEYLGIEQLDGGNKEKTDEGAGTLPAAVETQVDVSQGGSDNNTSPSVSEGDQRFSFFSQQQGAPEPAASEQSDGENKGKIEGAVHTAEAQVNISPGEHDSVDVEGQRFRSFSQQQGALDYLAI